MTFDDLDLANIKLTNKDRRIVLLTSGGPLSTIVINGLRSRLGGLTVIEEGAETKSEIIRRRARLLGWPRALSQAAAGVMIRVLGRKRQARIANIVTSHGLDPKRDISVALYRVPSVNSVHARQLLQLLKPDVVAVYGTRIISKATLNTTTAPFINYHAGINPKYRGQHPGYWALASGDADHAGVTIHLVDEGVDTGSVLYQAPCQFAANDTISSYQYLQAAHALPLFARAIADALAGKLNPRQVALPSKQWFPPTLGEYLQIGFLRGVW